MSRLTAEWQRLFQLSPDNAALMSPDGHSRVLVIALTGPQAWPACAAIWERAQSEFGWPAPAIAVNGHTGYQLWFSVKQPAPAAVAHAWAQRLASLAHDLIDPACIQIHPSSPEPTAHTPDWIQAIPMQQGEHEHWSAFVTRDLAPVFQDTPWLDIPPNPEGQADLLAALTSIDALPPLKVAEASGSQPDRQTTPKQFLLQVMHDPSAPLALRIEAAKALLPYSS